ncbi:TonB-dependent siderophore receptor [Bryobacter aggregatus]|uniref:TonB-dependent siderophore receptor n=1 Tax=Bryobacter aggregatus TaxID=360054 RepID=UPI0004E25BBF|nr:TonB-dependent siderophore receptor [Bryobacter aggregatus]
MRVRIRLKKKHKKSKNDNTRKWIAASTIASYTITGGISLAAQQRPAPVADLKRSEQTLPLIRFSVASGSLAEAIAAFEKSSGWKVEIPDENMKGLQSKGVSGLMPARQALAELLTGTGLHFRITAAQKATLTFEEVRSSIDVVDQPTPLSPRYTEPLRDIPQTITVIPKEIIQQQGATSLAEVLRNVPGMTITAGEGGAPAGDNLTLRGNSARNDIFVDGVRDLSPQSRDPFNLEQVEVTKGPTSAITGRGSAGGAINLISKTPNVGRMIGGSFSLGNADMRRANIDINTPLKRLGLGERTAFRMNALIHDANVPGRKVVKNDRWGLAPSLAFGLGTPTRITVGYYKLKQDNISDYGIPWVPATNNVLVAYRDKPAPVARDTFYGFANRDREVLNQDTGTLKFEHDFKDSMQLRSQFRFGKSGRNSYATPPRFASTESTVINREMRSWVAQDRILDSQTDLKAEAKTFGIRHSIVTGAAFTGERNRRINRTAANATTTLFDPNPNDVYTGDIVTSPYVGIITGNTQSAWFFDTAKFGNHLEANGGVRFEHFNAKGVSTTPAPVAQEVNFASLRGALIYKPTQASSIYGSYGSSVSPSLEGLSYNTANTAIPPEKTYTTEVGSKWEVAGARLLLSGALFQVKKDNARTPGLLPTDPPQVLAGRQTSQGLELSASGGITRSLRVLASYSLIDARISSSNTPAEVGRFFQNTPRNSVSVWATYTAQRFTVGVGPRFMGRRFGNNTNTRVVDSYATVDAMGSYRVNNFLDLRLNLSNLNNAYYFERLGGGHLIPGASRFVQFTTNFHF